MHSAIKTRLLGIHYNINFNCIAKAGQASTFRNFFNNFLRCKIPKINI